MENNLTNQELADIDGGDSGCLVICLLFLFFIAMLISN